MQKGVKRVPPPIRLKMRNKKARLVEVADIVCVIGEENYSRYYLSDNSTCLMARTLLLASGELPGFLRIHKQNLVNPAYIHRVSPTGDTLTLRSGKVLAISRRCWRQVREALTPWIAN